MIKARWLISLCMVLGSAAAQPAPIGTVASPAPDPQLWPAISSPAALADPANEACITALMQRMTLRQKIGQMIQADITAITPKDLKRFPLGSI